MKKTSAKFLAAAAALSLMMQTAVIANADSASAEQNDISAQIITETDSLATDEEDISDGDTTDGEYARGDVNNDGRVNVTDVSRAAAHIKSVKPLDDKALKAADANLDGSVNVTDLSTLAAHVKGVRAMDWLEKLETVPDEEIVTKTSAYKKLDDIITLKKDLTVSWGNVDGAAEYDVNIIINGRERTLLSNGNKTSRKITADMLGSADFATVKVSPYKYYNTPTKQGVRSYLDGYEFDILIKPADLKGSLKTEHTRPLSVSLSWQAAGDAEFYEVYCTVDGKEKLFKRVNTTNCTMQVLADKDYSFRVKAVNDITRDGKTTTLTSDNSLTAGLHTLPYYELAAKVLDRVGWDLRAAFNWSSSALPYYYMNQDGSWGMEGYADFGFLNGKGNCYVMAATFCEMAKMLGYDAHQIAGYTLNAYNQNPHDHSWVEIDNYNGSGITYIFDPDLTNERGAEGFAILYRSPGSYNYDINHLFNTRRIS